MTILKTLWIGDSWWVVLIFCLGTGLMALLWWNIFSWGGSLIHGGIFLLFLLGSIYFLVKFLKLLYRGGQTKW